MNKLALPGILVATVMVAGLFAFAPVEQASTVHNTDGIQLVTKALTVSKAADSDTNIVVPSSTIKQGTIALTSGFDNTATIDTLLVKNCLDVGCLKTATIFGEVNTVGDTLAFLGYGIILSGTTGDNDDAAGSVDVIVAYHQR